MHLQNIFVNVLAIEYLNLENESLEKFCRKEIQKEKDRIGLTQSLFFDLSSSEIQNLLTEVNRCLDLVHLSLGLSIHYKQEIFRGWTNLNTPEDIVEPHCHPESYFSAVYYVKAEKDSCAPLKFMSPIDEHQFVIRKEHIQKNNEFNSSRWSVPPETGKLLIFPSWLKHYVVGQCSTDRISMAFDTRIVKRDISVV